MKSIVLTSSGLTPEIADEVLKMVPKSPEDIKVGFIATASEPEEDKGYVLKDKAAFEALGITNLVDVDIKDPAQHELLDDVDIIFVAGGNTFYLMKYIRESGFDKKIKELLKEGKVYVGASAGSVVMGTSIEISGLETGDKNIVGLEDFRGLRWAPFMIAAHMNKKEKFMIDRFSATKPLQPIIGINDGDAIIGEDGRFRYIGPGRPERWNSKLFK